MFSPKQWILIDLATQFGMDKALFEDRLAFGRKLMKGDMVSRIPEAKEPEMFAKAILAVQDALAERPNGHCIGQDVASSGPQILSVLSRCITGMSNTGALGDKVSDLYTALYKEMDTTDYVREQVKKACVPFVYGSQKAPDNVFGEDSSLFTGAYKTLLPSAYAVRELLLAAWDSEALDYTWIAPDGHVAHIKVMKTVDIEGTFYGTTYTQRISVNEPKKVGMSLPAHVTHTWDSFMLREVTARCGWNQKTVEAIAAIKRHLKVGSTCEASDDLLALEKLSKDFHFVSIQGLEFIERNALGGLSDAYLEALLELGMESIKYPSFDVRGIHDEYACHANHVSQMRKTYNQVMAESYECVWLQKILKQLTGVDFSAVFPAIDPTITSQLKEALYAIH